MSSGPSSASKMPGGCSGFPREPSFKFVALCEPGPGRSIIHTVSRVGVLGRLHTSGFERAVLGLVLASNSLGTGRLGAVEVSERGNGLDRAFLKGLS